MKTIAAFVFLALCVLSVGASAKAPNKRDPDVAVIDNISCGQFIDDYQNRNGSHAVAYQMDMMYVEGALTGIAMENSWRGGPQVSANTSDRQSRSVYLYNYCSSHPLMPYFKAIGALVRRVWHRWPDWDRANH